MSEFSSLTTKLVTPLLKSRGYKKSGVFNRSPTHDSAVYRRENTELILTLQFHPYDYPEIGIRFQIRTDGKILVDRLYPPTKGGMKAILRSVIGDIEKTDVEVDSK